MKEKKPETIEIDESIRAAVEALRESKYEYDCMCGEAGRNAGHDFASRNPNYGELLRLSQWLKKAYQADNDSLRDLAHCIADGDTKRAWKIECDLRAAHGIRVDSIAWMAAFAAAAEEHFESLMKIAFPEDTDGVQPA